MLWLQPSSLSTEVSDSSLSTVCIPFSIMVAPTKVAIIGGSGMLGHFVTRGFLENSSYIVSVLTRKGGDLSKLGTLKSAGAHIIEADFADQQSLLAALTGQDMVVSTISARAIMEQTSLIAAAKAAGVRRFVPSEFGIDPTPPSLPAITPFFSGILAVRQAVESSGMEWSYIICGMFMEVVASFLVNPAAGKVTIKGNPDTVFTISHMKDVGSWTAEALLDPVSRNASVFFKGQETTARGIAKTFEDATGRKLDVTYVTPAQLDADIAASDGFSPAGFVDRLLKVLSDGNGVNWPDSQAFRGPKDASVTLAQYAATLK